MTYSYNVKTLSTIWVTFQKEGIHCYPEALTNPNLADVSFLGHPHRHIFHFRVEVNVNHHNREIEFIQFKRWLESLYQDNTLELNNKSCEMIANELIEEIHHKYPNIEMIGVDVSEDGENGSSITYLLD